MKQTISTRKETVAANLKKFRKEKKYKQRDVARMIFISLSTYQSYEEQRAMPPIDVLLELKSIYSLDSIECFLK